MLTISWNLFLAGGKRSVTQVFVFALSVFLILFELTSVYTPSIKTPLAQVKGIDIWVVDRSFDSLHSPLLVNSYEQMQKVKSLPEVQAVAGLSHEMKKVSRQEEGDYPFIVVRLMPNMSVDKMCSKISWLTGLNALSNQEFLKVASSKEEPISWVVYLGCLLAMVILTASLMSVSDAIFDDLRICKRIGASQATIYTMLMGVTGIASFAGLALGLAIYASLSLFFFSLALTPVVLTLVGAACACIVISLYKGWKV